MVSGLECARKLAAPECRLHAAQQPQRRVPTQPPSPPCLTGVVGLLGVHGLGDQELQVVADGALSHLGDVGCGWVGVEWGGG